MIDEKFICENCGSEVSELSYTARDHCPNCLYSKHVDNNPGDRASNCGGILKPIGIEKSSKAGFKIVYKCDKCGMIKKNIMAKDDNMDKIIELSTNQ
jgi:DNA-directed RNA polymerase subunit RPC12/RpoP